MRDNLWPMSNPRSLPLFIIILLIGVIPAIGSWNQAVSNPGDLDQSFGDAGLATAVFYGTSGTANAGILQPDGKIVTAGFNSTSKGFALARFHPDGTIDNSFGMAGKVSTSFSQSDSSFADALAIQPDLKIVAAGQTGLTSDAAQFAISRYLPNGSLDPSFGSSGRVVTRVTGSGDRVRALAIQADGKSSLSAAGVKHGHWPDSTRTERSTTVSIQPARSQRSFSEATMPLKLLRFSQTARS